MSETAGRGLEQLAARVRRDLETLAYPRRDWVAPRRTSAGEAILDVIIVGAGQGGLATAFALMRERVTNVLIVDQNPLDRAGPWLNFARMRTLRTPKHVTGPDLGIPSLTPEAFYEAQHGEGSWRSLGLIPKETWAAYLAWYRRTLEIPVRPDTRAGALRWKPGERAWEVPLTGVGGGEPTSTLHARRVVLATGIEGSGDWVVPAMIRDHLPRALYAHTRWAIDFAALAGKRVAVLGAGASAFDNAATALEHGAREVRLCFRRPALVNVNAYRWAETVGFLKHAGELPDADKWRFIRQIMRMGQLPPAETFERARRHAGFHLHAGCAWESVVPHGDGVRIGCAGGDVHDADFVIVGTGFVTDLSRRPELAEIEPHIARWSDRYHPPEDQRHGDLARHPYLGPSFEHTERQLGEAPYLRYLYNYTFGALASLGFGGASISGMKYSIPRLVGGITGSLFVEDRDAHFQSLCNYAEAELSMAAARASGAGPLRGIRGTRVVVDGAVGPATIRFAADGRIQAIDREVGGDDLLDVGSLVISPGLVDCHVHVNEPGRTEWEGFATATRAAAAGGVTTLVDMPLNCIPVTTTAAALDAKRAACAGQLAVDIGFWGGVIPGNDGDLPGLARSGALGCKAFLIHSGIDEFPNATELDLRRAMPVLRGLGLPLLAHAELDIGGVPASADSAADARAYQGYLASRPRAWEDAAIRLLIALCRETGCAVHIVHLSSASSLPALRAAKDEGLPITVETCPHYLCFEAEAIPDGATHFKCAPPIREHENREALWRALGDGTIDLVISDHSPCTPALKLPERGDFQQAWGGIASLQLGLAAVWTEARRRGHGFADIAAWMSERPARLAGLASRKGRIAPGLDADLVVWDPDDEHVVGAAELQFRHKISPYVGRALAGRVHRTILRGQIAYDADASAPAARGVTLLGRDRGSRA